MITFLKSILYSQSVASPYICYIQKNLKICEMLKIQKLLRNSESILQLAYVSLFQDLEFPTVKNS